MEPLGAALAATARETAKFRDAETQTRNPMRAGQRELQPKKERADSAAPGDGAGRQEEQRVRRQDDRGPPRNL